MGLGGREAQLQGERGFSAQKNWSSCTGASPWSKNNENQCNDDIDDEDDADDNRESDNDDGWECDCNTTYNGESDNDGCDGN